MFWGEILGFLLIPALIAVCGILNDYPTEYYVYALGIYLALYLAIRLIVRCFSKWLEQQLEKKS